ncbi:MAG TPA: type II and III secretion system protein [Bryobacteraceae bacterium]|nr:type II and III secretion system protein [Bryobacteraceae bacterium]
MYQRGRQFEKKGNVVEAYLLYSQAAAADPKNKKYWQRSQALRTKAAMLSKAAPAPGAPPDTAGVEATENLDPGIDSSPATPKDLEQARMLRPPVELAAGKERKSFDLRGDSKSLFEQLARAYALDVVFEGDYQPGPSLRFVVADADYREAFHALMAATSSFIVPISPRVFMVVKDTDAKRREVENTVSVTIPIPEAVTLQEAQELARSVQQVMEIQRFAIDGAHRLVFLRDRVSKVQPALALFHDLMTRRAEVSIELQFLSVTRGSSLGLGFAVPSTLPITAIKQFISLGGGPMAFGIGVLSAELLAQATRSTGTTLLNAEIRSTDGQAATFHAGDKYPLVTAGYFGAVAQAGQQAFTPPPTFNFEDLGLVLKITSKVHGADEVTLEIESEFKTLGAGSFNGIPVISNRKLANRVRLRFGEAAVVGGLVSSTQAISLSGISGLSGIPVLGPLVSRTTREKDDTEVLVVIRPKLLSLPPSEAATREIYIGTESRLVSPL